MKLPHHATSLAKRDQSTPKATKPPHPPLAGSRGVRAAPSENAVCGGSEALRGVRFVGAEARRGGRELCGALGELLR